MTVAELNMTYGKDIVRMYNDDMMSLAGIAKELKTNAKYVREVIVLNGYAIRGANDLKSVRDEDCYKVGVNGRKYTLNREKLEKWTSELAYIFGFISADGYVTDRFVRIVLKREDSEVLKRMADYIEYTGYIKDTQNKVGDKYCDTARLEIYDVNLVDKLKDLGIVNRKSSIVYISDKIPHEYLKDFIRGYFDGDGCVGKIYGTKSNTLNFRVRISSGSKKFIEDVIFYMESQGISNKAKIATNKKGNIFEICYSTTKAIKIHKLFYGHNPTLYLKRKKDAFDELVRAKNEEYNIPKS